MAPRETENNAYAKFWGDKQRALWYVMVFSGAVNSARPKVKPDQSFCPITLSPLCSLVFLSFPVSLYFPPSTYFSSERGLPSLVYTDTHLFTKDSKFTIAFPEISRIS